MPRIVCISDTHGLHERIPIPSGDILVHAGDCTREGKAMEVIGFLQWLEKQTHPYKVLVAGNHDFLFERSAKLAAELLAAHAPGVTYLNDTGAIIAGLRFWGSPVQPEFFNWAFNRQRGDVIQHHWDMIPADTEVLVTHGPPIRVLDTVANGKNAGCANLRVTIHRLPKLRLHVFGHLHADGGRQILDGDVIFVNASICNEDYSPCRLPIVVTL